MIFNIIETLYFDKQHISKQVHDVSCLYYLRKGNEILYIGQTKNLRQRLFSHLKENIFKEINYIGYIQIDDKQTRKRLEKELIYRLKPELNKRFIHYEPK